MTPITPTSYLRGRWTGIIAIVTLIVGVLLWYAFKYGLTGEWRALSDGVGSFLYDVLYTARSLLPV